MCRSVSVLTMALVPLSFFAFILIVFSRQQPSYNPPSLPPRSWQGRNTMLMAPHTTATIFIDDLIPLGPSCLAAYHFRRGGWRKASLPFDWTLFDDRQQHIPQLAKLVGSNFAPLLSLEQDTSALRRLHENDDLGHVNASIIHTNIPTMRWIHDDPLRNASKVVRRTRRLLQVLATSRRPVFTLAYGHVNEIPSPLQVFLAQLHDLVDALETAFPRLTGIFRILIIVETLKSNPTYRALASQLEKKRRRRYILTSVRPLSERMGLSEEETLWGNSAAWTSIMRTRFRPYTRNNETLATCLKRFSVTPYRHPKGIEGPFTRYGYFVCRHSAASQREFEQLDANHDGVLSTTEIPAHLVLPPPVPDESTRESSPGEL